MEPWVLEEGHTRFLEQLRRIMPRCCGCNMPMDTERYLDLEPFGLQAVVCERCMDKNVHDSAILLQRV